MGTAEKALFVISLFVVLTGLIGMLTAILTSLNERGDGLGRQVHVAGLVGADPAFALQREINEFRGEPMLAILPGVALQELLYFPLQRLIGKLTPLRDVEKQPDGDHGRTADGEVEIETPSPRCVCSESATDQGSSYLGNDLH